MRKERAEKVDYDEWEATVPISLRGDSLWKIKAYRLALFLADLAWDDTSRLLRDRRTVALADQLYRAVGSISANIAEGYSRGTGRDRARFYEYALGSARESRDWYYKSRRILEEPAVSNRIDLLTNIIRLLLTMVPQQRGHTIREGQGSYDT
jgi:four helix bundle protein